MMRKKNARRAVAVFVALLMFVMPLTVAAQDMGLAVAGTTNLSDSGTITVSEDETTVTIEGFVDSDTNYGTVKSTLDLLDPTDASAVAEYVTNSKITTLTISGALDVYGWLIIAQIAEPGNLETLNITTTESIPEMFLDQDRWKFVAADLANTDVNFTYVGVSDAGATTLAAIFAEAGVPLKSLNLTSGSSITLDSAVEIEKVTVAGEGSKLTITPSAVENTTPPAIGTVELKDGAELALELDADGLDAFADGLSIVSDNTSTISFSDAVDDEDTTAISDFLDKALSENSDAPNISVGEEATYYYNTPSAKTVNGVTATVTASPAGLVVASNTAITATVTLSGTASKAGTFTIGLASKTVVVSGGTKTLKVTAGQVAAGEYAYTFTIGDASVADLALTFGFEADREVSESTEPPEVIHDVQVISEDGAKYVLGSGKPFVVKSLRSMSGEYFTALLVDGDALALTHTSATLWESTYAKVEEGSTIATLYPAYLDKLSVGDHTVTLAYADGNNATVTFSVVKSATPDTGDESSPALFVTLLILAIAGLATCIFVRRRAAKRTVA
ncbi:MAG: hypothetical protein LBQ21_06540 [Clostridiales Family XIII bacterium]|jgi:hypothetical protein|nr:hypothetical protein [Clostridiales Family XIII bacterium]